jgi:type II secretory pathway component PulJ
MPRSPCRAVRGISIVEMLIGLAIGLLVVASAITALSASVQQSRRLLLDARLHQDLRTTLEVMSRDLRRAGHWNGAAAGGPVNPYAFSDPDTPEQIAFAYSRDAVENDALDANERFAYRLHGPAIELQLGQGNWQALTDPATITVSALRFSPQVQDIELVAAAPGACGKRLRVRSFLLKIDAHATADRRIARSMQSTVRMRNDALTESCA